MTQLDLRVRERTEELARANQRLKAVIAQRRRAEAERADLLRREQEARREAERVNRTKDEFLATLSHELRTPLNAMLGWAHLLETGQLDPDSLQRAVKVIKNNAFAQKQLIEDILDVSRIINGKMMLKMSSVDIRGIVDGALDTLRPAAEAKRITITTDVPDVLDTCGDRDRLQQVVWNLLSNAIKFTPRDGRVDVRVENLGTDLRIVVSDNGRGIAPAFLPHIFDRFSQADSTVTRAHGGLGLGMAIVRHLVELHGGTVQAESEGENRGATFTVTLPIRVYEPPVERAAAHAAAGSGAGRAVGGAAAAGRHHRARGRQRARRASGCRGDPAAERGDGGGSRFGGRGARARRRVGDFDLIVSDIAMPGTDGYEMMRRLRQGSCRFIPAIALTACVAPDDIAAALSAGYQKHLDETGERVGAGPRRRGACTRAAVHGAAP